MIHRLTIERFRGIRELTLRDPGRVNLIVGENNSGKSTVLEAIGLGLTSNPYVLPRPHYRAGRQSTAGSLVRRMRLAFNGADEAPIVVGLSLDFPTLERGELRTKAFLKAAADPRDDGPLPEDDDAEVLYSFFERSFEIAINVRASLTSTGTHDASFVYPLVRYNQIVTLHRSLPPEFPELPKLSGLGTDRNPPTLTASLVSNLIRNGQIEGLHRALTPMEQTLERLVVLAEDGSPNGRSVVEVQLRGSAASFPLASMGEGFARAIDVVGTLASVPEGICTVDEIENGIHYSAQADLWRAVRTVTEQTEAQLWATTHSYECVRAAWEAFRDAPPGFLRVHRLERRPDGSHRTRTMDEETLPILLRDGAEIR